MNHAKSLIINFHIKLSELQRICMDQEVEMKPYCLLRTCEEQSKIYRGTRTIKEIKRKLQSLRDRDLLFLADILDGVGPQIPDPMPNRHVTNAGPG